MKKNILALAVLSALASAQGICADDFAGFYIGGKLGVDRSTISGGTTEINNYSIPLNTNNANAWMGGLEMGYNWMFDNNLVGLTGFYDYNSKRDHTLNLDPALNAMVGNPTVSFGSQVYGLDLKLGRQFGDWLPYAKLGWAWSSLTGDGSSSGTPNNWHGGLGVEYKLTPNLGVSGEWTATKQRNNNADMRLNNFTLGLNYYFGAPQPVVVAPAPAPAPAPLPVVTPTPKPAPAPAPAPAPKCTEETASIPVRIDGASFANASAKLKPGAYAALDNLIRDGQGKTGNFTVAGYTDSRGSLKLNKKLSGQRANAVKQYLVSHGIDANRITTVGYGPEQPVASNATEAGRAKNRRVEIQFTKTETTQKCN